MYRISLTYSAWKYIPSSLLGITLPRTTPSNLLKAALITSVSHVPQPQRRNELKARQADLGHGKSQRGKRKQDARETDAGESSMLDLILRSPNDIKSEVGGFRKLLLDY